MIVTPSTGEAMEAPSLEPAQVNEHAQDHHQQYASLSAHTTDHGHFSIILQCDLESVIFWTFCMNFL